MSIDVQQVGNSARITLAGELTIYTVAEIKARLIAAMDSADGIEVDLSGITEVDTAGLQLMLIAKRNQQKKVVFTKHPPAVLRLVDLANLGSTLGDVLILDATQS